MAKKTVFLPAPLMKRPWKKALPWKSAIEVIDGFKVPGFVLKGNMRRLLSFAAKRSLYVQQTVYIDVSNHFVLGAKENKATYTTQGEYQKTLVEGMPAAFKEACELFVDLVRCTGRKVEFHMSTSRSFPPFPKDDPVIHVVIANTPPGDIARSERLSLCGIPLNSRGLVSTQLGPTVGQGVIVEDENEQAVGQVVDNTLYLLVPPPYELKWLFTTSAGVELYKRALRLVWNAYVEARVAAKPAEPLAGAVEYQALIKEELANMPLARLKSLEEVDADINSLTARLRRQIELKRTLTAAIGFFRKEAESDDPSKRAEEWERISQHPLVNRIFRLGEALHVETKRIICEHEGSRYDLGTFVIRIKVNGHLSIWSTRSTHPERIPHPHISLSGACFGSATLAIETAGVEVRLADVVCLVLDWLSEGYDQELTLHKINEWPKVE